MKYDAQIVDLKASLSTSKNILITLPNGSNIDKLAAGLALYLSLRQQGKEVTIACEDTLIVGQAHLFAIDRIVQSVTATGGNNLVLTLEGVEVDLQNKTVPALEKLDWYPGENNSLNLVFNVLPGKTFQPSRIVPNYQSGGFDLIFVVRSLGLNNLGNIYLSNQQAFSVTHVVNIDNQAGNFNFGRTNVVDTAASSISEIMTHLLQDLQLPIEQDIATNLLNGTYDATANLSTPNVTADTFMAVSYAMKQGGQKPQALVTAQPVISQQPTPQPMQTLDLSTFMPSSTPVVEQTQTPIISEQNIPSPEEAPRAEGVGNAESIEPDWLTPKVYKGTNLG